MRSLPDEQIRSSDSKDTDITEPIAIVGVAAKFAKDATSVEDLWDVLREGRSTWSTIPKTRFNHEAFYHPDPEHGGTVRNSLLETSGT